MSPHRVHEVVTDDGVTIRATVQGQGPPLVLLQGVMGDGDLDWQVLVPHLAERFTCHLPSMRGRGRSDDHANLRIDRIFTDYTAYVESLGGGRLGSSGGLQVPGMHSPFPRARTPSARPPRTNPWSAC